MSTVTYLIVVKRIKVNGVILNTDNGFNFEKYDSWNLICFQILMPS